MTSIGEKYKEIFFSEQYLKTCLILQGNKALITHFEEVAYMVEVIKKHRPKLVYEVGSFFCETTKVMAEALTKEGYGGILITTDPYGSERCPRIIENLPEIIKNSIKYYPFCSMQMIMHLTEIGKEKRHFDLTFIDGNHDFEYALFDLLSASKLTNYGGSIVVDNIENRSTRQALSTFLKMFPFWTCILNGECVDSFSFESKAQSISDCRGFCWAVVIAPEENIVGKSGKVLRIKISDKNPTEIVINFADSGKEKNAACELRKYYFPFNLHTTGIGAVTEEKILMEIALNKQETSKKVDFLKPTQGKIGEGYWLIEAELFPFENNKQPFVLLDRDNPLSV